MSTLPLHPSLGAGPPPALLDLLARMEERGLLEHGRAVAALAVGVCDALSLPELLVDRVEIAALLHDAGKVELPQELLDRTGRLSHPDWRSIREHPLRGARLVAGIPGLDGVAAWIRAHHERWDGRGYPHRLAGEQIPLAARIVHACDAFDAMTRERPYRGPLSPAAARSEIAAGAGSQLDPVVARALLAVVRDA